MIMMQRVNVVWIWCTLLCTCLLGRLEAATRKDFHLIDHTADLDIVTFDKLMPQTEVAVVLFLHYYAYGNKFATEFKKFAKHSVSQPKLLSATVGVLDDPHGAQNMELARRYNINMDSLPHYVLFVNGQKNATFDGEVTSENLMQFVKEKTGLWVGKAGTLEYYEQLVKEFITAHSDSRRETIADEADEYIDQLSDDEHIKSASYYGIIMDNVLKDGPIFLEKESFRLKKLYSKHRFHVDSTCGIKKQMNILDSFSKYTYHPRHDEL